jgi:copper chaperone CopZ
MKKLILELETLACPSCLLKIEKGLLNLEGVDKSSIEVLFNSSRVRLNFDENQLQVNTVIQTIQQLGYEVLKAKVK